MKIAVRMFLALEKVSFYIVLLSGLHQHQEGIILLERLSH